jgi:hypothetical protein
MVTHNTFLTKGFAGLGPFILFFLKKSKNPIVLGAEG